MCRTIMFRTHVREFLDWPFESFVCLTAIEQKPLKFSFVRFRHLRKREDTHVHKFSWLLRVTANNAVHPKKVFLKSVPESAPESVPKSVPKKCPKKVSQKSAPKNVSKKCPKKCSQKSVPKKCSKKCPKKVFQRASPKSVPKKCPSQVLQKTEDAHVCTQQVQLASLD